MSSPSTSRSASPELTETMHIFVKPISGDSKAPTSASPTASTNSYPAIPLTVPQDCSIQNLAQLVSLRTSLPVKDLRLVHAGKHLSLKSSSTLTDLHIHRDATLHMAAPLRGGAPKKIRCTYKDCREGAQRIIGDCGFCNGHYCGKHRLLEDHKCDGLEDVSTDSPSSSPGKPAQEIQWWLVGLHSTLELYAIGEKCYGSQVDMIEDTVAEMMRDPQTGI